MYEIHNLMYFYHRIYPASGPSRKCNEPILYPRAHPFTRRTPSGSTLQYKILSRVKYRMTPIMAYGITRG